MKLKYIINLNEDERRDLEQMTSKGKAPVRKVKRAQILLHADPDLEKANEEVTVALRAAAKGYWAAK